MAKKLEQSLPQNTIVTRGGFLSKRLVNEITVRFDDYHYQISRSPVPLSSPSATITTFLPRIWCCRSTIDSGLDLMGNDLKRPVVIVPVGSIIGNRHCSNLEAIANQPQSVSDFCDRKPVGTTISRTGSILGVKRIKI